MKFRLPEIGRVTRAKGPINQDKLKQRYRQLLNTTSPFNGAGKPWQAVAPSSGEQGAAAAIGGRDFSDGFGGLFDGRPRCEAVPGATATARDLDWG